MSEKVNGLSPHLLRPAAIKSLGRRIARVEDLPTVSDASWHIYGGLYKVLYRMGESETTDRLSWSHKQAAAMLMQAHVVANLELTSDKVSARSFTDLMIPLTERLDSRQASLPAVRKLNSQMIGGYITIAESELAMKFVVSRGVEEAMHESLKEAGRDLRRQPAQ